MYTLGDSAAVGLYTSRTSADKGRTSARARTRSHSKLLLGRNKNQQIKKEVVLVAIKEWTAGTEGITVKTRRLPYPP